MDQPNPLCVKAVNRFDSYQETVALSAAEGALGAGDGVG